jgi:hypothetical protein
LSGQVHYSGYRFLHGFKVKMKGFAVTMRFLGCIRVRSYGSSGVHWGHPGDWREQRLALIERVVDDIGNTDIWAGFQGLARPLRVISVMPVIQSKSREALPIDRCRHIHLV